ncbi:MAG: hypothetical protein [Microvirus sp.]|nr:MAG: hypothetical protein [Microvirus sp.]
MSIKIDLSDAELSLIQAGLQLYADSIKRQSSKHPTGSALHSAFSINLAEVSAVQHKLFSLKA